MQIHVLLSIFRLILFHTGHTVLYCQSTVSHWPCCFLLSINYDFIHTYMQRNISARTIRHQGQPSITALGQSNEENVGNTTAKRQKKTTSEGVLSPSDAAKITAASRKAAAAKKKAARELQRELPIGKLLVAAKAVADKEAADEEASTSAPKRKGVLTTSNVNATKKKRGKLPFLIKLPLLRKVMRKIRTTMRGTNSTRIFVSCVGRVIYSILLIYVFITFLVYVS